jgi:hypothetical protein
MPTVRLGCVVEGHGDALAVPTLVRRLALALRPELTVVIPPPIRTGRFRLVRPGELERAVGLAASHARIGGGVLVLVDAEDDCPATLARSLLDRAVRRLPGMPVLVQIANREFEAWFLAAAASLKGACGLRADLQPPPDPESIRDAKGWLRDAMPLRRRYRETLDQDALARMFDLETARRAPSFERLYQRLPTFLDTIAGNGDV